MKYVCYDYILNNENTVTLSMYTRAAMKIGENMILTMM